MKNFFKKRLASILKFLAGLAIRRFKPLIVGVTGSVGKTSTKFAIAAVLGTASKVRASKDSLNNEFGFPLTILGDWNEHDLKLVSRKEAPGGKTIQKSLFWLKVIWLGFWQAFFGDPAKFPEVLVLEYGADRPGDIKHLLSIAKPSIGVVTAIGEIPVHIEFYEDVAAVSREKAHLVESLPANGYAILNFDDDHVFGMKEKTRAQKITFGFLAGADLKISNFENKFEEKVPSGVSFKIEYAGNFVPVRISGVFGRATVYAAAAAAAVGLSRGINLVKIAEALSYFQTPPSRMKFSNGINKSIIIDDSYNAAPSSMTLALATIQDLKAERKVAVLGDMRELGKYTLSAHEAIGKLAAETVDLLICVGESAKIIADSAVKEGMKKRAVMHFTGAPEAAVMAESLIKPGDLVLIKASRAVGLEEVVKRLTSGV